MPDRISEDMPNRMSEDIPDKISKDMPDGMPDRYARPKKRGRKPGISLNGNRMVESMGGSYRYI